MSADPSWNDTKVLLHEVESLFTREDDVRDIQEIKKMAKDIRDGHRGTFVERESG